jgi:hypothetical protein
MLFCSNPTIWKFLDCLKKEQDLTDVKITKMMMQEAPEPRSAKCRKYDEPNDCRGSSPTSTSTLL